MTLFELMLTGMAALGTIYFLLPSLPAMIGAAIEFTRTMPRGYAGYVFACAACSAVALGLACAILAVP